MQVHTNLLLIGWKEIKCNSNSAVFTIASFAMEVDPVSSEVYLESDFTEATHILVYQERFSRLTAGKVYEIFGKANENHSGFDNPWFFVNEPYVIDDRGVRFSGFLTIQGKYLKNKINNTEPPL